MFEIVLLLSVIGISFIDIVETMNEECRMTQKIYEIRVKGQLDKSRSEWFEGWTITQENDGTNMLTGRVIDQSALHGVLIKIRNLNLPIVSVNCIESE